MKDMALQRRSFLVLQGSASRFFGRLGAAIRDRGYDLHRINFNGGDMAFWPLAGAVDYTGSTDGWAAFLTERLADWAVTDIVLLADCRPMHRIAIDLARPNAVAVHVFEEGYMRPNWITLERGGVNAHSSLGRTPEWFLEEARSLPDWSPPAAAPNSIVRRALEDIAYVTATAAMASRYPGYRTHRPWSTWVEYTGGGRRFFLKPFAKRRLARTLDRLAVAARPYYLFPLQLEADTQIQRHSPFGGMRPAVETVLRSFAGHAPRDAVLLVTEHPLDTCPIDWRKVIARISLDLGIADRVLFFEGGSPERAIQDARGVITVNSTIGYLSLSFGKPLIALGVAIYGIRGLTFQDGLDRFWSEGAAPDPAVFDAFRRVVAARTQINGSFYSEEGLALAVKGALARLEAAGDVLVPLQGVAEPARRPAPAAVATAA